MANRIRGRIVRNFAVLSGYLHSLIVFTDQRLIVLTIFRAFCFGWAVDLSMAALVRRCQILRKDPVLHNETLLELEDVEEYVGTKYISCGVCDHKPTILKGTDGLQLHFLGRKAIDPVFQAF